MSVFDDEVRVGTLEILSEAGDQATRVSPAGDVSTFPVILDRDVERAAGGMQSGMMERRTELTGQSGDMGDLARGEVITIGEQGWRLVSKDSDDGHVVTWIVKEER